MPVSGGGIIRLRRWIDNNTAEDDFYDVPGDQYEVIADLIRQGNKQEALLFLMQRGQKCDPPPTIEMDDF